MAAKSKESVQPDEEKKKCLGEDKKKLSEDLISFIRKRSDADAPLYTAKLRTVLNLERKRRKASTATARRAPPHARHTHRFHHAKKTFSRDELIEAHADQAESVENQSRSRSRSASIALSSDLDDKCARKKKKKRCKKKMRSCSCKKKRKRSCHKKRKRSCHKKRKRSCSRKPKKTCHKKKKACRPKRC